MIHVTAHAIDRFRERIADLPEETIRALLSAEPIRQAADFGANWMRIAGGLRGITPFPTFDTETPYTFGDADG